MANRQDLRKHERALSNAKVEMGWVGENGAPKSAFCECKDLGRGGFRIVSRDPIPERCYVQFRFTPLNFRGSASVRSMRHSTAGYEIGLEFSGSEQLEIERLRLLAGAGAAKRD